MTDKLTAEERAAKTYVDWSRTPSSGLEVLIANAIRDAERDAKAEAWRKWTQQLWINHSLGCPAGLGAQNTCTCGLRDERRRWEQEQKQETKR